MHKIKLKIDHETPLFYISIADIRDVHTLFGKKREFRNEIFIPMGDVISNFYKRNCHMTDKVGLSKGKMLGLRKEYKGFSPVILTTIDILERIAKKEIELELENK